MVSHFTFICNRLNLFYMGRVFHKTTLQFFKNKVNLSVYLSLNSSIYFHYFIWIWLFIFSILSYTYFLVWLRGFYCSYISYTYAFMKAFSGIILPVFKILNLFVSILTTGTVPLSNYLLPLLMTCLNFLSLIIMMLVDIYLRPYSTCFQWVHTNDTPIPLFLLYWTQAIINLLKLYYSF